MKKRVFCILLTGMMAAMLAACGGTSDNQESRATAMTEPQATAAESQMTETTESETETETEPGRCPDSGTEGRAAVYCASGCTGSISGVRSGQ